MTTQCMRWISEVLGIPPTIPLSYKDAGHGRAAMSDLGAYASRGTYTSGHAAVKTAHRVTR